MATSNNPGGTGALERTPSSSTRRHVATDPFLGNLQYLDEMQNTHVKGNLVRARSRYIKTKYGDAMLQSMADSLPREARGYLLDPPLASTWVSVTPMIDIDRAILVGPMKGELSQMVAFGADIAAYDLPTIYRAVLTMLSRPAFFFRRLGMIFSMYIKEGTMEAEVEAGRATATLSHHVLPMYLCTYGISGWFSAAVETYGVKNKNITHVSCRHRGNPTCNWLVTWSEKP